MGRGFDGEAEQNERKAREAVIGCAVGFFGRQAEEHRQIGDRTRRRVPVRRARGDAPRSPGGVDILQAEFGDRLRQGASEAGCLSDGSEIGQALRGCGGMNDARGQRFDAEAGDGSERETSHGLRGEVGGELRESECVNALAARRESAGGEFIGGGSRGGDDEDFRVLGFFGEERSGALEQCGVGAGVKERARGHRQLYWVEICQRAALGTGNGEILIFVGTRFGDLAGPIAECVVFVEKAGLGAMLSSRAGRRGGLLRRNRIRDFRLRMSAR